MMPLVLPSIVIIPMFCWGCGLNPRNGGNQPDSILGLASPTTPTEAAAWAADPYDDDKRFRGTLLLANAPFGGERVYLDLYERASTDEDPRVRTAAIRGLALHGSPEHVPLVLAQLDHEDRLLRWESARALQRLHNPAAVPALIKHVAETGEEETLVREAAAEALGQYAEPRVLDGLIAALGDRDLSVSMAARRSLRTLTGQDLGPDPRSWVQWKKEEQNYFAGRTPYIYPVFERDKKLIEILIPIFEPPNEIASNPVGFDMQARAGAPVEPVIGAATPADPEAPPSEDRNN